MKQLIRDRVIKIIGILIYFLWFVPTSGQATGTITPNLPADSIRLSLLTCAPGQEIYSLFGHTAIRYEQPARGIDVVFNYGMFSFNTPNFMMRFALGRTDYQLGATDYAHFAAEYEYFDRSVWQQTINLTQPEKEKLIQLLETNYRPINRTYRYNFFHDNCATRPRDKIEESILGNVIYRTDSVQTTTTFRDIVHQYTKGHPWAQFGIDFCIGNEADLPITDRQTMFAPYYLMNFFATAHITTSENEQVQNSNNEQTRFLITNTKLVVDCERFAKEPKPNHLPTPMQSALLLFMLTTAATIYGLKKRKSLWFLDLILFGAAGIAGCVITFLVLFSEHPAVGSNYLLFVFHPGQLLSLPFIVIAARKDQKSWYHFFNLIVLTFFILLFPLIPQRFDLAVVPLALCLLIRSANNLILTYKREK